MLLFGTLAFGSVFAKQPVEACNAPGFQQVLHAPAADPGVEHARAHWLDRRLVRWPGAQAGPGERFRLHHSATAALLASPGAPVAGADDSLELAPVAGPLPPALADRFAFVGDGATLAVAGPDLPRLPRLLSGQLLLAREDAGGRVIEATALQVAGALDDLYAAAADIDDLGTRPGPDGTRFRLWAPTAREVAVCLYPDDAGAASAVHPLVRDDATGAWTLELPDDLSGRYYAYLVDVFARGHGVVRNRVTDPWSVGLGADSRRSFVADLDHPALKPEGWDAHAAPVLRDQVDMAIYELHVRDFSRDDASVSPANRGRYLAFTEAGSEGMRHLRRLAAAGITDVHLLPVFDLASVPESGCVDPDVPDAPSDSERQQAAVMAVAADDCFNWGYDPLHFNVPEGSYSSNAADGAARIREFRGMVMALHAAGLRVGKDVVYNHTSASGQHPHSVLDRIVPGYYHRLDADGAVERSTCCDNTATEHAMMEKLMVDSAVLWVRHYGIDSFRFDLMGHQPRAAMERLQRAVDDAAGRRVQLIGEGWNFGEVADGARFVQASQLSLGGSGIGTFSDRARDAVRGGGPADSGEALIADQGWVNGLVHAPNDLADPDRPRSDLLHAADLVRVGLAGTLRDFRMTAHDGVEKPLSRVDYKGQPAGYAEQPGEVVNYVENHDNQTLFDINVLKLPRGTSSAERARVQALALATVAFSQGIAYFHAGGELLRSKSLDRNSYDSGDWFNRVDWTMRDNFFGTGLPPEPDNGADWDLMRPLLADPGITPDPDDIRMARDIFLDLLRIRSSTPLFRLRDAGEVKARLTFPNSGPGQDPLVVAGHLDGSGYPGAGFREVLYFLNASPEARTLRLPGHGGKQWTLHPVHRAADAADPRPAAHARHDAAGGAFTIPGRTALVYVIEEEPELVVAPGVTGTLLRHEAFPSRHVDPRNIDVWLPPGYGGDPGRRYPVLYMHDGQNLFDPGLTWAGVDWDVDGTMARLVAEGTVRPAIVVGIWNTPKRLLEYMPRQPVVAELVATGVEGFDPFPRDDVVSDAYLRFIVEELKPAIDARYRTLPGRGDTFIAGSSMGGLVSLYAVARYPGVFGGAAALSTHWPAGDGAVIDWLSGHLPEPGSHRFYFDHGTATLDAAYAPLQQRMDAAMRAAGYRHGTDWETRRFEGAEHNEPAWRERLHLPLMFLLQSQR